MTEGEQKLLGLLDYQAGQMGALRVIVASLMLHLTPTEKAREEILYTVEHAQRTPTSPGIERGWDDMIEAFK